jgi:hypothetical protein
MTNYHLRTDYASGQLATGQEEESEHFIPMIGVTFWIQYPLSVGIHIIPLHESLSFSMSD